MTGWGAGYCTGSRPGNVGGRLGWGGRPWGYGGYGWRNRFYATGLTRQQQTGFNRPGRRWPLSDDASADDRGEALTALTHQLAELTHALEAVRQRIEALEAGNKRG
jgi:hypothetical protein